jgi:hypothetical protein
MLMETGLPNFMLEQFTFLDKTFSHPIHGFVDLCFLEKTSVFTAEYRHTHKFLIFNAQSNLITVPV